MGSSETNAAPLNTPSRRIGEQWRAGTPSRSEYMLRGHSLTPVVAHGYAPTSDGGPMAKNFVRDIHAGRAGCAHHLLAGRDTRAVQLGAAGASGEGGAAELPDFVGG